MIQRLRHVKCIREIYEPGGSTLSSTSSPQGNIAEGLDQWPENMTLEVQYTMQGLTDTIFSLANGQAVGPNGIFVELYKITLNGDPAVRRRLVDIVVCI